jgi:hypothetical protein
MNSVLLLEEDGAWDDVSTAILPVAFQKGIMPISCGIPTWPRKMFSKARFFAVKAEDLSSVVRLIVGQESSWLSAAPRLERLAERYRVSSYPRCCSASERWTRWPLLEEPR